MKIRNIFLSLILTTLLVACDENSLAPFASNFPSVDERFKISMSDDNVNLYDTIRVPNKEYKIYVCTDTHVLSVFTKATRTALQLVVWEI